MDSKLLAIIQLICLFSVPLVLFFKPKFIRDFMGDRLPIVLGVVALIIIVVEVFI